MANIMRMNGQGMNKKAIYLFKNGSFVQQPSSNTFRVSNGNLTNGDNTTSCKWNNLNDKIKIFILIGKYRDIDGNIQIASSGFIPTFKTINIQTSWNSGAGKYHDVTFVAVGKDLSLQTIAYGAGDYQMQYSEIYYYEL